MNDHMDGLWNGKIFFFESLPSTNLWAQNNINKCSHGDVIWTRHQTNGRGRFTRQWITPEDSSLTISIILDITRCYNNLLSIIMPISAISISHVLASYSLNPKLKWPNDVLINNRKVAGILAEKSSQTDHIILGIGININQSEKELNHPDMLYPATSIAIETGKQYSVQTVLYDLIGSFKSVYNAASRPSYLASEWTRSDFLMDKQLTVTSADACYSGKYRGINSEGQLLIETNNGKVAAFWSGDVSIGRQL